MCMETKFAWAAGVIDGEGCVHIKVIKPSENNNFKRNYYNLTLELKMTHKPTLEKFVGIFDTLKLNKEKRKKRQEWHKQGWVIVCSGKKASKVIYQLCPYMVTKKDEALVALKFWEYCNNYTGAIDEKYYETCEYYRNLLQQLKKVEYVE